MMAGRPPKPTQLKILQGTDRPDRRNAAEPSPEPHLPAPPKHLPDAAKVEYRRLGRQLLAQRVMTDLDRNALALYCLAWARAADAQAMLAKYGEVVETPQGFPVQSPYLQIYNKAVEQMVKLGGAFGLEPSSRSRIKAAPAEDKRDPFAEFLANG